jgi:hypothetical protein
MKFRRLKDGAVFQFVGSNHSMAEYEKVDAAHYRLVGIGTLIPIDQCPKGDDEQVVSQDAPRSKR